MPDVPQFETTGLVTRRWQATSCVPLAGSSLSFSVAGDELVVTRTNTTDWPPLNQWLAAAGFIAGPSLLFTILDREDADCF
jgi:hypothetical protein